MHYFPHSYICVVHNCTHLCGWLLLKCSAVGIGFNGVETNCGITHNLCILLMNSYNIFFSNYYNLQSVHLEWYLFITTGKVLCGGLNAKKWIAQPEESGHRGFIG